MFNDTLTITPGILAAYYFRKSYSDAATGSVGQMLSYIAWNVQVSRDLHKSGNTELNGYIGINNIFNRDYWFRCVYSFRVSSLHV
ncbi:hypothetical protein [Pantoea cypripedii]|uniref:TonB-dependent receptor-like beta-barrel domain-containing protein n=1 Tax=Pantoea cypripedii TaxID=55209 RepID=A0A1X1EKV0_PANCY|nr:hypothetical protein [Pantoea cypripedii]MBP2198805.1 outer membrane receptor for Fe3+-dicitrate [Pantoea cypripedii]ORM89516.1 hypothetical protein HA50_23125 [Pantoea cypripedii]